MKAPLIILDTPALYYRAFYALPDTIRSPEGFPVNAVRGVLDTIAQLSENWSSTRIVATMDADWRPAFRTAIVPEYKAQRIVDQEAGTETPPDLEAQLPLLRSCLIAAGIPVAEVAGSEADDVIASLIAATAEPVVIVSPDRDLLALLDDAGRVTVCRPKKGGVWEHVRAADLPELYGVPDGPSYRALAALRGDPSDGLPGVPGIGEKTAAKLIAGYGSLDAVIAAAQAGQKDHGLSPKRQENIVASAEAVRRGHQVMTCADDLDVAAFLAAVETAEEKRDAATLRELAGEHGFERSAERLIAVLVLSAAPGSAPATPAAAEPATVSSGDTAASADQGALFPAPEPAQLTSGWTRSPVWGFDLETTGTNPHTARIVTAALCEFRDGVETSRLEWLADAGVEIPAAAAEVHGISTDHVRAHGRPLAEVLPELLEWFSRIRDDGGILVGHNIVYDLTILEAETIRLGTGQRASQLCPPVIDTFVIDKQVDPYRRGSRVLTALAEHWSVELDNAHDATADALAAVEIALRIAAAHPETIGTLSAAEIHAAQIAWKRDQSASFERYLRRKRGDESITVSREWPFETPQLRS